MKKLRHLSIHVGKIRRRRGESLAGKLAYITRSAVENPRTGRMHDYSARASEVVATGTLNWHRDSTSLVEEATFAEKRRDACEGREITVALPEEFDDAQNFKLLETCAGYFVGEYGVAAVLSLHRPPRKGRRNKHGHIAITSRRVEGGHRLGAKTRILDSLKTGGLEIRKFRSWWCATLNFALRARGLDANIEHRSFGVLGIKTLPTRYQGVGRAAAKRNREAAAAALEARHAGSLMMKPPTSQIARDHALQAQDAAVDAPSGNEGTIAGTGAQAAPATQIMQPSEPTCGTTARGRPPLPTPHKTPVVEPTL